MKKSVQHAIGRLSEKLGFPLASLPLFTAADTRTAYTSNTGVYVNSELVVSATPLDLYTLECFVAHEIFHWVLDDSKISHLYSPDICNWASDFRINDLIHRLYGYDVRKAKVQGLYRKRYRNLRLPEIAADVAKYRPNGSACGGIGFPHPLVAECAVHLRNTLNLEDVSPEPLALSPEENNVFFGVLSAFKTTEIELEYALDQLTLVRSIWAGLYCEKPTANAAKGDILGAERAMAYTIPYDSLRHKTVGDANYSLWCAVKIMQSINVDQLWVRRGITRARDSVVRLKQALRSREMKKQWPILRIKLVAAKRRLARWRATKYLSTMLKDVSKVTSSTRSNTRMTCLMAANTTEDEVWLPKITGSDFTKRVRKLVSLEIQEILGASEMTQDLTRALGESIEDLAIADRNESESKKTKGKEDTAGNKSDTDDDGGDDKISGVTVTDDSEHGVDSQAESNSVKAGSAVSDPKKIESSAKYESYNLMYEATDIISRIYEAFVEVESLLQKIRTRSKKVDDIGQDTMYEYGNVPERAVAEELAFLASEELQLVFLSRLAQHQLLQVSPQKRARSSVVLMVDASGSMSGKHYALAVGFTLALVKWMHQEKRGIGIVMFSSVVDGHYFVNPQNSLSLLKILRMLLSPSFGGTCFDVVADFSIKMARKLQWKRVNYMMITDGGDNFRHPEDLKSQLGKHNKMVGMITSSRTEGLATVCEEVHKVSGDNMHLKLTKQATRVTG